MLTHNCCCFSREIETVLQCYDKAIEDETEATRTYVQQFGDASFQFYYEHYGCSVGKCQEIII